MILVRLASLGAPYMLGRIGNPRPGLWPGGLLAAEAERQEVHGVHDQ